MLPFLQALNAIVAEKPRHPRFMDLTGKRFGDLIAVQFDVPGAPKPCSWLCSCDCGGIAYVEGSKLQSGHTKSCGCRSGLKGGRVSFDDSYVPEPNSGCWLWTGGTTSQGYGSAGLRGYAHRWSWEKHCGPIPDGMLVCHKCDVRPCVNPDHLFLGTHEDNSFDMARKDRGGGVAAPLLSIADVRAILCDERGTAEVARQYAVSESCIADIRHGRNWRHVSSNTCKKCGGSGETGDGHDCNLCDGLVVHGPSRGSVAEFNRKIAAWKARAAKGD